MPRIGRAAKPRLTRNVTGQTFVKPMGKSGFPKIDQTHARVQVDMGPFVGHGALITSARRDQHQVIPDREAKRLQAKGFRTLKRGADDIARLDII